MNFSELDFLILDNTAFVSGFDINVITIQNEKLKIYIPEDILKESAKNTHALQRIEISQEQGKLIILEPQENSLKKIKEISNKTGDIAALSPTDQKILAIALDLKQQFSEKKIAIMSDDYSIQNAAKHLDITIIRYQKQGIKKEIKWEIYCPACYHTYHPSMLGQECEMCGEILKRRPFKGKKGHL